MRRNTAQFWLMMMMGRSRTSNSGLLPIASVAVFIAVVFFATGVQAPIRGFFAELLSSKVYSPYESLSRVELEERLKNAEKELEQTKYQSVLYALLAEENKSLRAVATLESITNTVSARVLSRPPRTHYDTLLVGAGSAMGVSVHDTAVFNGVLLGKVISVTTSSATVELFSTPKSERDVILGTPSAVAVARGLGGGSFQVLIPQEVVVGLGEYVRAAADDTLILGVVVAVSGSATEASKTVHVATPVSMSELDFVSIVPHGDI